MADPGRPLFGCTWADWVRAGLNLPMLEKRCRHRASSWITRVPGFRKPTWYLLIRWAPAIAVPRRVKMRSNSGVTRRISKVWATSFASGRPSAGYGRLRNLLRVKATEQPGQQDSATTWRAVMVFILMGLC